MTPIPLSFLDDVLIPLDGADPALADPALAPVSFVNERDALNRLTRLALQPWLAAELDLPVTVWPARPEEISALVDGVAFSVGDWRIVVVAQDAVGADELLVSQEWVDSPSWRADYYVGVRLEQREGPVSNGYFRNGHFRIVGCTTHQLLKAEGNYDAFERLYSVEPEQLLSWNLFCSCYQNYGSAQTQEAVAALAELETAQAQQLIARLGDPQELLPRLEVPFAVWGALLANESWRSQLYQARYGQAAASESWTEVISQPLTRLSDWLRGQVGQSAGERGLGRAIVVRSSDPNAWQPPEALLSAEQLTALALNPAQAADESSDAVSLEADQGTVLYRAKALGPALEEATLIVGLSAPEPENTISDSEASGEVEVQIQLRLVMGQPYSPNDADALPNLLRIKLLAEDGSEIAQASAERDEALQIELSGSLGESFTVEIAGGQQSVMERFVI